MTSGSTPQPPGVILGAGAQLITPSDQPESAQSPGTPTPVGSFNITQLGDKADKKVGGDRLFAGCVIAVNADTGEYVWHFQTSAADFHTENMHILLADMAIDGQKRRVAITAPKNGFFYVIDRVNGKLISAEPFVKVNWASRIDVQTGRPVENPDARYPKGTIFTMWPYSGGGHGCFYVAAGPLHRA